MRRAFLAPALVLVAACGDGRTAPPAAPAAPSVPAVPSAQDERGADEAAYRAVYLPRQADLAARHRGEWLAVVRGLVVPMNGSEFAPAASIEEADAVARSVAPAAKHRFVFRIGDEGDVVWPMGGCELQHVVGMSFIGLFEDRDDVKMKGLGPGERFLATLGDMMKELTVKGPDARMYVRPDVGRPTAVGTATELYCVSTGFAGFATMSPATAAGLELWEIPGTATISEKVPGGVVCRRAYARFAWPNTKLDFTIPVAVWPK